MVMETVESVLKRLYETAALPSSYGGVDALLRDARKVDRTISRKKVKEFLEKQSSYTLHKLTRKKFVRRKVLSPKPKVIASCDLADLSRLSRYNRGYKFLLVVIDVFSRFLQIVAVKKKSGDVVGKALKAVLEGDSFRGVSRLNSDEGKEFYNRRVEKYLRDRKIKLYSVHSREIKASIAERVIRTIKSKIYRYLTHNNTLSYINALKEIVASYNNSPHRGLGGGWTPAQVHALNDEEEVRLQYNRMYNPRGARNVRKASLSVGTTVRIADENRNYPFRRGFTVQNTYEIFKIRTVDKRQLPYAYYLSDLKGEEIQGIFYREELVPTTLPDMYNITILRRKKVGGRTKYLVKWRGYPDQFNSWIDEEQVTRV